MMRGVLLFLISVFTMQMSFSQELLCKVDINTMAIEGTNKNVFETLQQSISDYFNETKWTNTVFSPQERIDCRFFLTVKEYSNNRIKGDIQVQLSRPVYNSTYTTTLFNFKDSKVEFDYREGEPLVFNDNIWTDNLTGILNFYAYLFLALDFDSFSPGGGQPYFDKATTVAQQAQSSGEAGWKTFEDTKNRSAVLSSYTDKNTGAMRDLLYQYHRKGLDEMFLNPEKGRAEITSSLKNIKDIYDRAPMSVGLTIFRDSKLDELLNVYSKAPQQERDEVFSILSMVYPTDSERLQKIKKLE